MSFSLMCFSQRINVHFPEYRWCHFPKTYFIIFREKSKKTNIPLTDQNCDTTAKENHQEIVNKYCFFKI